MLGDTVDAVERLEDVAEEFDKDLIVTKNTLDQLDEEIPANYMGQIRLKNSADKIKIFELKLPQEEENNNWSFSGGNSYCGNSCRCYNREFI